MSDTERMILALLLVFATPYLVWRGLRLRSGASLVVVQIMAGVALGPGVMGALLPGVQHAIFTAPTVSALNAVASWAVMLFVWLAGLELDLGEAWASRRETGATAALALGAPLVIGAGVGLFLLRWPGWSGPASAPWQFALGVGMACAVTALPILVLLLQELGLMRHPLGGRVLRYASLDDVAIWAVLAVVLCDWSRVGRQLAFVLVFALAAWGMRALSRRLAERDLWPVSLIWLLACAWGADAAGLHAMVGAFLAGAVLDRRAFGDARVDQVRQTVLLTLMPVFFLSTGLKTRWALGGPAVLGGAALFLAAAVGGKLAGLQLAGRLLGWKTGEAAIVGWLLQTKALIMIIFVSVLLDRRMISQETFTALLLMALASTVLTLPMTLPRLRRLLGADPAWPLSQAAPPALEKA